MPVHRVGSKWQWGTHGALYDKREDAVKQAEAAFASGYKEDDGKDCAALDGSLLTELCETLEKLAALKKK